MKKLNLADAKVKQEKRDQNILNGTNGMHQAKDKEKEEILKDEEKQNKRKNEVLNKENKNANEKEETRKKLKTNDDEIRKKEENEQQLVKKEEDRKPKNKDDIKKEIKAKVLEAQKKRKLEAQGKKDGKKSRKKEKRKQKKKEKKQKQKERKAKAAEEKESEEEGVKPKKKIKITYNIDELEDKTAEYYAYRELSLQRRKFLGAHVSVCGGSQNGPINTFKIAGQAFACFLKNQRRWDSAPLDEECIASFKDVCSRIQFPADKFVLPHSSYLINLANPDDDKREKSYAAFLDDLQRCEQLGISLCNFHPGSTVGECEREEGIRHIAECINRAHKETKYVKCVVENMSGQKNVIASKFEDIQQIIELVEDKTRVGVCLDTCHLFAAGYDVRTKEKFDEIMKEFDGIVGLKYLCAMHVNDSKAELGSGLDRHENIGKGKIGMECFEFIMKDKRFEDIPLILETADETSDMKIWQEEIRMLYDFIK